MRQIRNQRIVSSLQEPVEAFPWFVGAPTPVCGFQWASSLVEMPQSTSCTHEVTRSIYASFGELKDGSRRGITLLFLGRGEVHSPEYICLEHQNRCNVMIHGAIGIDSVNI